MPFVTTTSSLIRTQQLKSRTDYAAYAISKQDIQNKVPVKSVSGMTNFNEVVQGDVYTKLDDLNFILANNSPATGVILTAPTQPTFNATTSITSSGLTVNWSGGTGATSYTYTLDGSAATPSSFTTSSATFMSLAANTVYSIIVTAVNSTGSTVSSALSVTTLLSPPTQPSLSLQTGSITSTGFTVNWSGGTRATSYTYTLNGSAVTPSSSTSQSATFTGLAANTGYSVIVTAVNNGGSTPSSSLSITTLIAAPTQPTDISGSNITSSGFTVNWTGGSGATSYTYTINGSAVTPSSSTSQSATFTSLAANTAYSVIVTAVNNGGSAVSSPFSVTTLIPPPTQPTFNPSTSITSTGFTVNWSGGSGATSYTYTLNGSAATPSSSSSQSATFTGLSASTAYSVIVTAVNAAGSTSSSSLSVSTYPSNALVSLRASSYSGSGTWNDESGNGKNATIASGTIAKNGAGNGIVLNGSTHWTFPNIAAGNSWTVSVWFKLTSTPNGTWAAVVNQTFSSNRANISIGTVPNYSNRMVVRFYNGASFNGANFFYTLNTWINMAGKWNGTTMTTYINGTSLGSTTPGGTAVDSGQPYIIGRDWSTNDAYIEGEIGEVTIFNTP